MFEIFLRLTGLTTAALAASVRRWTQDPWLKSASLETAIAVGDTSVTVSHGLGRTPNGAVIVATSAAYALTVDLPTSSRDLTIRSATAVATTPLTVRLRVF